MSLETNQDGSTMDHRGHPQEIFMALVHGSLRVPRDQCLMFHIQSTSKKTSKHDVDWDIRFYPFKLCESQSTKKKSMQ